MKRYIKLFEDFDPNSLTPEEQSKADVINAEIDDDIKNGIVPADISFCKEDVADPLTGGGVADFKQFIDTKNNALENGYRYDEPAPGYLDGTFKTGGKIKEDTTNTPGPQQQDAEEKLANSDMSSFALPLTNNESKLEKKIGKNMKEWKAGTLKSGSGKKVTDQKQALAIAYSEAGKSKNKTNESHYKSAEDYNNSYRRTPKSDDFIGGKSKDLYKSDSEIHTEHEATNKHRAHEKEREEKDKSWNEKRKAQSEKDKAKAKKKTNENTILRFENFVNEKYGPEQEKLEKNRQKAVKNLTNQNDKTAAQKKVSAIRVKTAKSATK